ncbi:MAG: hypothetical protein EOO20_11895 [Chryseobacterium sp.]|nr:MAG: hypothetical protein EOO20_11895 [Chryseobacterium sp.]
MIKIFVFIFVLFFSTLNAFAVDGCLIGNTIYSTRTTSAIQVDLLSNGMNVFKSDSPVGTNNCITGTIQGTCQVCHGNPTVGLNLVGIKILVCTLGLDLFRRVDTGVYYSSYILECNLDAYSWALGTSAAALGLYVIRKRKLF